MLILTFVAVLFLLILTFVSASLIDNVIAYYKLDEASGAVIDSTGTYNGTNNGATPNVAGKINTAYDFEDSESDYISTNLSTSLQTFTVCAWIKLESTVDSSIIVGKDTDTGNRGWVFRIDVNSKVALETNGGESIAGATVLDTGTWYFVCGTSNGTNQEVFLNGVSDGTGARAVLTNADTVTIGRRNYPGFPEYADGIIDEVLIANTAFTTDEIDLLWNNGDGLSWPFVVDTCSCPGAGEDWEIDMSDYCNITTACDLTTGTLSFTGAGWVNCSAAVNTTNLGDPGATGILWIYPQCRITIN